MDIKTLLFGKTKKSAITSGICCLLLLYIVAAYCFTPAFFKTKCECGAFTFYADETSPEYERLCQALFETCAAQPFANPDKKVKVYFVSSKAKYAALSLFRSRRSLGQSFTFFNRSRILLPRLDVQSRTLAAFADAHNTRGVSSVLVHEYFHACMTKTVPIFNGFRFPNWKEEALAEFFAGDSSFDMEKGLELFVSGKEDAETKTLSYKYFVHRLCGCYLMRREGLSLDQALSDKRSRDELIAELKKLSADDLRRML